jgi:hypothetical protein
MDILQRDSRYYLQLSNGELELTEQQALKRVERGDLLVYESGARITQKDTARKIEISSLNTPIAVNQSANPHVPELDLSYHQTAPKTIAFHPQDYGHSVSDKADAFERISKAAPHSAVTSGKYFDNLLQEFEHIYQHSDDKPEALDKLVRFCKNSITKLHHDRKNPKSDPVVIDFFILSWTRIMTYLQSLPNKVSSQIEVNPANSNQGTAVTTKYHLTRQLLMVQLLQADGLFPISDALQGITQNDIVNMISGMLNADKEAVQEAIQTSSSILLKRGITRENIEERIALLQEMEKYFDQLPYSNIISRVKLLIKIYYEMAAEK